MSVLSRDLPDTLTPTGAHELAGRIRDYWAKRGYSSVKTFVEPVTIFGSRENGGKIYCVRSNIGPTGFPQ